ncbi:UTP6 family protein [Megaselia abdita]
MAEFVEFREERMLPDYERMKNQKVVDDDELIKIQRSREKFDYRISRQGKTVKDFFEYILYERKLLALFQEREKNRKQEFSELIYSTANHVKALYRQALALFPQELELWENFIKFCKHSNFSHDVSRTFERMLQFHGDKSDVWLRAAMWEYRERDNSVRAKDVFLRGLQRHPQCTKLTEQFFRCMLLETSKLDSEFNLEDGKESAQSLGLKMVLLIYENSKKHIKDVKFLGNLLIICEDFPFTKGLQKTIIQEITENYPKNEEVWDILAKRELRGFHMIDLETEGDAFSKRTSEKRIEMCCMVYQNAVTSVNTSLMWKYFIDALLELNQDMEVEPVLKRRKLGNTLKEAHEAETMSEEHYLFYTALLEDGKSENNDLITDILLKATELYSTSSKLWCQRLYHAIKIKSCEIESIFSEGRSKLEDIKDFCQIMIRHWNATKKHSKIEEMFKSICFKTDKISAEFREPYLEWTSEKHSIEKARKLYDQLNKVPPPSLTLHYKMAELESKQDKINASRWRTCYDIATFFFGKTSIKLWMDFIKFEQENGDPSKIGLLYERAKDTLDQEFVDDFIGSYSLLKTL